MYGLIFISLVVLFFIVLIFKCVVVVSQSETMIYERLGKFHKSLHPGLNLVVPIIDRPRSILWRVSGKEQGDDLISPTRYVTRIDLREQVYDYPKQNVITKDNVNIEIDALLYFQITDPKSAVYEVADLPNAIEKLTQTTLRNVVGEMELDETLTSRDTINTKLTRILDEATDKWGVKVNRVELKDIMPPRDIRESMEKQMRAERDRRAQILKAEGEKTASILEAEGVRESRVNRAEGERQAAILLAEGEAKAKIERARAESEALELVTKSFGDAKAAANYLATMRYIETLASVAGGKDSKVVYMPYEATGVLSAVGGIREMLAGGKGKATS